MLIKVVKARRTLRSFKQTSRFHKTVPLVSRFLTINCNDVNFKLGVHGSDPVRVLSLSEQARPRLSLSSHNPIGRAEDTNHSITHMEFTTCKQQNANKGGG